MAHDKIEPNAIRWVYARCNKCSGLRLVYEGKPPKARRIWSEAEQAGQHVFFESKQRPETCRCIRLVPLPETA